MEALTAIQTRNSVSRLSGKVSPDDLEKMISRAFARLTMECFDHGELQLYRGNP